MTIEIVEDVKPESEPIEPVIMGRCKT